MNRYVIAVIIAILIGLGVYGAWTYIETGDDSHVIPTAPKMTTQAQDLNTTDTEDLRVFNLYVKVDAQGNPVDFTRYLEREGLPGLSFAYEGETTFAGAKDKVPAWKIGLIEDGSSVEGHFVCPHIVYGTPYNDVSFIRCYGEEFELAEILAEVRMNGPVTICVRNPLSDHVCDPKKVENKKSDSTDGMHFNGKKPDSSGQPSLQCDDCENAEADAT